MNYLVHISHEARKSLKKLDRTLSGRLVKRLEELAQDPLDQRFSKQMETKKNQRYSQVGDWRIIYQIREAEKTLQIVAIRPRSRAYE
ncbi:MAG: type II toxin-antitoxin system RelE family toxin [Desulfobacteraceae bacterium]